MMASKSRKSRQRPVMIRPVQSLAFDGFFVVG
jgi:hypothetical protein